MTNNINSTNSIDDLFQYLNNLNLQLDANTVNESERIDLISRLESTLVNIQGQTLSLETRVAILGDDSKDLSQVQENLFSLKKVNATWGLVYHKCIQAQLASLTKTYINTSLTFANNPQQSPETTKKQYGAIKKIVNEFTSLSRNPLLNEKEKRCITSFLPDAKDLLTSLEKQINTDLDKALAVVGGPVVPYKQDSSELNIGQFVPCSNEILLNLLSFLSPEDLGNLTRCSKFFRDICEDDSIWKNILQQEFPSLSIPHNKSAKEIYSSQKTILSLKNGLYSYSKLQAAEQHLVYCLRQHGNLIFSGGGFRGNFAIKIWDITRNQYIGNLEGHKGLVVCFEKAENLLFSGSIDGTIKIWNLADLNNIQCIATLKLDDMDTVSLHIKNNLLFSGSSKGVINIWDLTHLNNIKCIATLLGHDESYINSLHHEEDLLFSGSGDKTIKIWNLKDLNNIYCIATLLGHEDEIRCLQTDGNRLFSGSSDGQIKVWDLTDPISINCITTLKEHQKDGDLLAAAFLNGQTKWYLNDPIVNCIATLKGHQMGVNSLQKKGNLLISASNDNTIKIWDLTTNQYTHTLKGHTNPVISLQIEGDHLVSGSNDGTVNAWNLNASAEDTLLNLTDTMKDINRSIEDITSYIPLSILSPDQRKTFITFFERIKDLSPVIRNEIYGALYEIDKFERDYFGCAEHAFLGTNQLHSTLEKKIAAIHRYLLKEVVKLFKNGNSKKALDLFKKLPNEIKDRVSIFLNLSEQKIADDKKIEAIEKFLESTKVKR